MKKIYFNKSLIQNKLYKNHKISKTDEWDERLFVWNELNELFNSSHKCFHVSFFSNYAILWNQPEKKTIVSVVRRICWEWKKNTYFGDFCHVGRKCVIENWYQGLFDFIQLFYSADTTSFSEFRCNQNGYDKSNYSEITEIENRNAHFRKSSIYYNPLLYFEVKIHTNNWRVHLKFWRIEQQKQI